jgi:1,4-dihydroxy-2-naphthoate octaprenyltransferase
VLKHFKNAATNALFPIGLTAVAVGAGMALLWAGVVVAGLACCFLGWLYEPEEDN